MSEVLAVPALAPDEVGVVIPAEGREHFAVVPQRGRLPFAGDHKVAIARLAATMHEMGGIDLEPVHYFADGLYARELTIPAGTLLISHIHRERHICLCSKGAIAVFQTDNGTRLIEAPFTFVSEPDGQRVGYAYEETAWTTFHATDERDLDRLEELLYAKQDFPPYVAGDIEILTAWLGELARALPAGGDV